jgi:hypothetical protein
MDRILLWHIPHALAGVVLPDSSRSDGDTNEETTEDALRLHWPRCVNGEGC